MVAFVLFLALASLPILCYFLMFCNSILGSFLRAVSLKIAMCGDRLCRPFHPSLSFGDRFSLFVRITLFSFMAASKRYSWSDETEEAFVNVEDEESLSCYPFIDIRDGSHFCAACQKWATPQHIESARHKSRISWQLHGSIVNSNSGTTEAISAAQQERMRHIW